jgi:hypothetical protein
MYSNLLRVDVPLSATYRCLAVEPLSHLPNPAPTMWTFHNRNVLHSVWRSHSRRSPWHVLHHRRLWCPVNRACSHQSSSSGDNTLTSESSFRISHHQWSRVDNKAIYLWYTTLKTFNHRIVLVAIFYALTEMSFRSHSRHPACENVFQWRSSVGCRGRLKVTAARGQSSSWSLLQVRQCAREILAMAVGKEMREKFLITARDRRKFWLLLLPVASSWAYKCCRRDECLLFFRRIFLVLASHSRDCPFRYYANKAPLFLLAVCKNHPSANKRLSTEIYTKLQFRCIWGGIQCNKPSPLKFHDSQAEPFLLFEVLWRAAQRHDLQRTSRGIPQCL